MVSTKMLPGSLVLLISTILVGVEALPLRHVESGQIVQEALATNAWGAPGAGAWQSAWPYIPAWSSSEGPTPAAYTPAAYTPWWSSTTTSPTVAPTSTEWFTTWTSETYTSGTTIISTITAPTTTIIVGPSPTSTVEPTTIPITTSTTAAVIPTSTLTTSTLTTAPPSTLTTKTKRPHSHTSTTTPFPTTTVAPTSTTTLLTSSTSTSTTTTSTSQSAIVSTITAPTSTTIVVQTTGMAPQPTSSDMTLSTSIIVPTATPTPTSPSTPNGQLSMSVLNNLGVSNAYGYLTGVDTSGALVMLTTDGTFYTPTTDSGSPVVITANVALPLTEGTNQFTIPGYISSARLWFSVGPLQFSAVATEYGVGLVEPTVANINDSSESVNWGFVELTYNSEDGLFANLSFVDFVGLGVGMSLTTTNSGTQSAPGMPSDGATAVCNGLKAQAAIDGQPWDQLCETDSSGNLIRVLSPGSYLSIDSSAFEGYFDDYVNQVWDTYTSQPLYIQSQTTLGLVTCQVSDGTLNCDGDNRGYAQPTSQDIFSCSTGAFSIEATDNDVHRAVVPRLCAAFNRATLLIPGGNVQPKVHPNKYYTVSPNNMYSKIVHGTEIDGEGYAFPYDDVTPGPKWDVAGIVASPDPEVLTVTLGG